jgi:hypothetical protein
LEFNHSAKLGMAKLSLSEDGKQVVATINDLSLFTEKLFVVVGGMVDKDDIEEKDGVKIYKKVKINEVSITMAPKNPFLTPIRKVDDAETK